MFDSMRQTDDKVARFQALRQANARGKLLAAERSERGALFAGPDTDEADALGPALAKMNPRARAAAMEAAILNIKGCELLRIAGQGQQLLTDVDALPERLDML